MVAIGTIALPIVLAVMGVFVALKPPATETIQWIWIVGFVVVGFIAIGTGIADRRNADAAQDRLQQDIKGLKDAVEKLTQPISEPTIKGRDPDTIYQNGNSVGKVIGARITLNESKVYFEQIENAGNLDRFKTFEYRDYVLRFLGADSFTGMLVTPGRVATNVYQHVVCEIVGRV
jgi:hypothetical protein